MQQQKKVDRTMKYVPLEQDQGGVIHRLLTRVVHQLLNHLQLLHQYILNQHTNLDRGPNRNHIRPAPSYNRSSNRIHHLHIQSHHPQLFLNQPHFPHPHLANTLQQTTHLPQRYPPTTQPTPPSTPPPPRNAAPGTRSAFPAVAKFKAGRGFRVQWRSRIWM